jgi:hypothetical protein
VTFFVLRDVEKVDRAEIIVENGAFGAFQTRLEIRGNDYNGMTSHQLCDLALMFLDAAEELDKGPDAQFERGSPTIARADGDRRLKDLPRSLDGFIPKRMIDPEEKSDPLLEPFFSLVLSEPEKNAWAGEKIQKKQIHSSKEEIESQNQVARALKAKYAVEQEMRRHGYQLLTARRISDIASGLASKREQSMGDIEAISKELSAMPMRQKTSIETGDKTEAE